MPTTTTPPLRVLLTDGSGLTSRQVATRLHALGHHVEVLSPDPLCLARFTRHVHTVHRVPRYGDDPLGWLEAALAVFAGGRFDVLFPTQEQVAVLAHQAVVLAQAGVATAVPSFDAVRAVQDKAAAAATLTALGVAQPPTRVVTSPEELARWTRFPVFAKAPIGTASSTVRLVRGPSELQRLSAAGPGGLVLQEPADGTVAMVQGVFDRGRLVAFHANERVVDGPAGGAAVKRSRSLPTVRHDMAHLGAQLHWHGALSADVVLTPEGPRWIDVNPRLVEPGNALAAGVDLTTALLAVATGRSPDVEPSSRDGVVTRQLLLCILGAAQHRGTRRGVAVELWRALAGRGVYAGAVEELTPWRGDWRAVSPVALAAVATLASPAAWRWLSSGAVGGSALSPAGWDQLCSVPPAAPAPTAVAPT